MRFGLRVLLSSFSAFFLELFLLRHSIIGRSGRNAVSSQHPRRDECLGEVTRFHRPVCTGFLEFSSLALFLKRLIGHWVFVLAGYTAPSWL